MSDDLPARPASAERPSKTQRKKEMTALQALGARLVALSADQLGRMPLPERLREAVLTARRITAHEARRRQMQFIGRLMREVDPAPIERALADLGGESRAAVALMHRCERWRDRLLADDAALTELLAAHPRLEPQPLRACIRAARRERDGGGSPRHCRELYRRLRELFGTESAERSQ